MSGLEDSTATYKTAQTGGWGFGKRSTAPAVGDLNKLFLTISPL